MVAINTGNSSYHTTNQAVTGNAGASAPGLIGVGKEPTQNRNNQTAQQAAQQLTNLPTPGYKTSTRGQHVNITV